MDKLSLLFQLDVQIQDLGCKLLSMTRWIKYLKDKENLKRNSKLYERKKNKKCYVIGLGPSLKEVDLKKIDGDTIVTNRFYIFDKQKELNPTYYFMSDDDFFVGGSTASLLGAVEQYPESAFLLNGKYRKQITQILKEKNNLFFLDSWGSYLKPNARLDLCKLLPIFNNCVCGAIACAIALGYEEIILLGCDFNSFASPKALHCYNEKNSERLWSMSYELFCYSFVAHTHASLRECANKRNIQIKNATTNSLIDAYPKINCTELKRE